MAADKRMPVKNPLEDRGLKVLDATATNFKLELEKFIAPKDMPKMTSFLPYSLIVVNNTGRYIYSLTVIYTYPNRIAPAGTPWQHRVSPTAGSPDDRRTMIEPGASYLVTPISDFIVLCDAKGRRVSWPYLDEGMDRIIKLFELQDASERIEASVDSIIFEDGTLAGPDTSKRMDKVNSRMRAERDLLEKVGGLRGDELRKQLVIYSELKTSEANYSLYRATAAKYLLRVLDSHGETAAIEAIEKFASVRWFANSEGVRRGER